LVDLSSDVSSKINEKSRRTGWKREILAIGFRSVSL